MYPPRALKEGARVTRIAPSPTGYLHLGVFFTAMVNRLTASASDGVFYFRLEDTDKKREVAGGAEDILTGLNAYGLTIDEGFVRAGEDAGRLRPYQQSRTGGHLPMLRQVPGGKGAGPTPASAPRSSGRRSANNRRRPSSAPATMGPTPPAAPFRPRRRSNGCGRARPTWCGCAPPAARKTASNSTI